MNRNIHILKTACYALSELKQNERKFNRALVVAASTGLMKRAGYEPMKKKAWLMPALALGAGLWAGGQLVSNGAGIANWMGRAANHMNSDWGQNAVVQYANSGNMSPEERNNYLITRLSPSANYNSVRNRADAYLAANRETAYKGYKQMDASLRGNRMINSGVNGSRMAYNSIRNGGSGYGYGMNGNYSNYRY